MTVNLSIKNVPDDLAKRLRERAKENHRSLQGELMSMLEAAVFPRRLTVQELRSEVKSLGLRTSRGSVEMIREGRDAK